jgi:hypothetical protein
MQGYKIKSLVYIPTYNILSRKVAHPGEPGFQEHEINTYTYAYRVMHVCRHALDFVHTYAGYVMHTYAYYIVYIWQAAM